MTPTLSPQQREEVLEAMARAFDPLLWANSHPSGHAALWRREMLAQMSRSLDAALPAIIGAVLEAVREDIRKRLAKAHSSLGGVEAPAMKGDNLAVSLCSFFDEGDDWPEGDGPDDCGWSPSAVDGYTQTLDAIRQHYTRALAEEAR